MNTNIHAVIVISSCSDSKGLTSTLDTLERQVYPHWGVLISDPDPTFASHTSRLSRSGHLLAPDDLRTISNFFVLPLLSGDLLTPDALARIALVFHCRPDIRVVYSDHFEYFGETTRLTPFFKPGWSPEFLLATNYLGRPAYRDTGAITSELPPAFNQIDVWKFTLSLRELPTELIYNIERPLVQIRYEGGEAARSLAPSCSKMLQGYLNDNAINGNVFWPKWAQDLGVLSFDIRFPDKGPSVTIVIPTRNNKAVLERCIASLECTTYENYSVLVVDNMSDDAETIAYLNSLSHNVTNIPSPPGGFNYSFINNEAARCVKSELILFLNDDTEVVEPCWLSNMVGYMQIPEVASVGARLIFPDGRIQHAGLVNGLLDDVLPAPAFKLMPQELIGPHGQDRTVRNYSAVTAACMLTRRELFLTSGGFDESAFGVAYNDVDYGFRLTQSGYRHVFVPSAELRHFEGASRGRGEGNDKLSEELSFINKYKHWNDPYYNNNLSRESFDFTPRLLGVLDPFTDFDSDLSVALITHNLNYEGASLVLLDIARGLRARPRTNVLVISLVEGPLRPLFEDCGCNVIVLTHIGIMAAQSTAEIRSALQPVQQLYHDFGADVVLANTVLSYWSLVAAGELKIPGLWFIHESEPPFSHLQPWGPEHVRLAKSAYARSFMNIFCCKATKALYRKFSPVPNSVVMYNGFDGASAAAALESYNRKELRSLLKIPEGDMVFITPGTVCERKSQLDVIEAVSLLGREIAGCSFLIVGDREGEYSRRLHVRLGELPAHIRAKVSVFAETDEIWKYYRVADALLFPSRLESFPRVIQEAMHCGLAIVTTSVFGIAEQLRHNESAIFVDVGDTAAMARAIKSLHSDRDYASAIGRAAKASLSRFPTVKEMQLDHINLLATAALAGSQSDGHSMISDVWLKDVADDEFEWVL